MALRWWEDTAAGVIIASLGHDDLLLESLRDLVRAANISNGVLLSGIGSLSAGHIHIVSSNSYPPTNEFLHLPGPLEVVNFGGIIAGYFRNDSAALWDAQHRYFGGHLEDGCRVLTLIELSILRLSTLQLTRGSLDTTHVQLLKQP
ncbi:MAG: DNA-binding protein [Chloroflexi bacterium]|nr:DNA-binding protein [Chloroflexota bacterium]